MTQVSASSPLEKTFRLLLSSRHSSAGDVLSYAVTNASGEARRLAVTAALDKQDRTALAAVLRVLHELPEDLKGIGLARAGAFLPVLRQNVKDGDRQVRANTCDFLVMMDDARVAYLLADLLQDPAEDIAKKAQDGLLSLAHGYHTFAAGVDAGKIKAPRQVIETKRYALLDALLTALRFYRSHERPQMIATLLSLDPRGDEVLLDILANPMDRRRKILAGILGNGAYPRVITFLLTMLKTPRSAPAAVDILEARADGAFVEALLSHPGLFSSGRIVMALGQVKFVPWMKIGSEKASRLPPRLAVRAVRYLLCTGAAAGEKRSAIERLSASKNVALAAAAKFVLAAQARQITLDKVDAGLQKIEQRCPEPAPVQAEPPPEELVVEAGASRSAAPRVDVITEESLFVSLVNSFDTMSRSAKNTALGEFAAKGVLLREIRKLLGGAEPDAVLRAIKVVEWQGCQPSVARELTLLTRHPDSRVRSAAVRQLGKSAAYDAMKALFEVLADRDRRVLANAVEALEATGHKQIIRLLEPLMKHPDNRIRANAAKAAWTLGSEDGRAVLVEMLKSPKSQMRISGLWGLRQIGAREETGLIREIAAGDRDEAVRKAADGALAELENVL